MKGLLLSSPIGLPFCDVLMSLHTIGALKEDSLGSEFASFLTSYRATRLVMESMLEAIPQTTLQLYITIRTALGCEDYPVSWSLLTSSLALSMFTFFSHLESI